MMLRRIPTILPSPPFVSVSPTTQTSHYKTSLPSSFPLQALSLSLSPPLLMASSCLSMFLVFLALTVPADSNYVAGRFPRNGLSRRSLWSPETVPAPPPLWVPMPVIYVSPAPPLMVPPFTQGTDMTINGGRSKRSSGSGLSQQLRILIIVSSIVGLSSPVFYIYSRRGKGEQRLPLTILVPVSTVSLTKPSCQSSTPSCTDCTRTYNPVNSGGDCIEIEKECVDLDFGNQGEDQEEE